MVNVKLSPQRHQRHSAGVQRWQVFGIVADLPGCVNDYRWQQLDECFTLDLNALRCLATH